MEPMKLVAESIIKIDEIKQETMDPVWDSQEFIGNVTIMSQVKEEDDNEEEKGGALKEEEEELMPPAAVFIKQEVEWEEEEDKEDEGPVAVHGKGFHTGQDGGSWSVGGVCATSENSLRSAIGQDCTCAKDDSDEAKASAPVLTDPGGASRKHLKCEKCSADNTSNVPVRHKRTHAGEKSLRCPICLKEFTYRLSLYKHMTSHADERPHCCSVCEMSYRKREHLVRHMRMHSGETPYHCAICEKGFRRKDHLERHMWSHSEEKPFYCAVCQRGFNEKQNLVAHMKQHADKKRLR